MVNKRLKVVLDNVALSQLRAICDYIKKDTPKNSAKVNGDILSNCLALSLHPEKYPLDKYKTDNDGTFRAFEKHHLRIAYCIQPTGITIISVRHARMEPRQY